MTDREAWMKAVVAAPDDDNVRLVMADWLDETGDPVDAAHAALIRAGCAWEHEPKTVRRNKLMHRVEWYNYRRHPSAIADRGSDFVFETATPQCSIGVVRWQEPNPKWEAYRDEVGRLLWGDGSHRGTLLLRISGSLPALPGHLVAGRKRRREDWRVHADIHWVNDNPWPGLFDMPTVNVRRGFVDGVRATMGLWVRTVGDAFVANHPVREVRLTEWMGGWVPGIPEDLWSFGPGFGGWIGVVAADRLLAATEAKLRELWPSVQAWSLPEPPQRLSWRTALEVTTPGYVAEAQANIMRTRAMPSRPGFVMTVDQPQEPTE